MEISYKDKFKLEILWWIITAVLCIVVVFPLVSKIDSYSFLIPNIIFVVVFVTMIRHLFLLKYSLIAKVNWLKICLTFVCVPLVFYLIQSLNLFQTHIDNLDDNGWSSFFGQKEFDEQKQLYKYMRAEMILFGSGAIISSILFPIRMIISVWRQRNRGTV